MSGILLRTIMCNSIGRVSRGDDSTGLPRPSWCAIMLQVSLCIKVQVASWWSPLNEQETRGGRLSESRLSDLRCVDALAPCLCTDDVITCHGWRLEIFFWWEPGS